MQDSTSPQSIYPTSPYPHMTDVSRLVSFPKNFKRKELRNGAGFDQSQYLGPEVHSKATEFKVMLEEIIGLMPKTPEWRADVLGFGEMAANKTIHQLKDVSKEEEQRLVIKSKLTGQRISS